MSKGGHLELRQNKNDSIWSKNKLDLKLPRFFTCLFLDLKSAAISKLICVSTKLLRSYIVFALDTELKNNLKLFQTHFLLHCASYKTAVRLHETVTSTVL